MIHNYVFLSTVDLGWKIGRELLIHKQLTQDSVMPHHHKLIPNIVSLASSNIVHGLTNRPSFTDQMYVLECNT